MREAEWVITGCLLAAFGLFLPGCGGEDGPAGVGGSCRDYAGATECLEYTGADWVETSAALHCQGMGGTREAAGCELQGAVGRCTISLNDPLEYYHVYYERPVEAEAACLANNGVWEAL